MNCLVGEVCRNALCTLLNADGGAVTPGMEDGGMCVEACANSNAMIVCASFGRAVQVDCNPGVTCEGGACKNPEPPAEDDGSNPGSCSCLGGSGAGLVALVGMMVPRRRRR